MLNNNTKINNLEIFLENAKIEFLNNFKLKRTSTKSKLTDFHAIRTIGVGSFGTIILANCKKTQNYVAIKIISKEKIFNTKQTHIPINERNLLRGFNFPFVISLIESFQDFSYLYMVMPYINGGDLYFHLRHYGKLKEIHTRFYAAQLCLALEYLHYINVVYRDLKCENLVLTSKGDLILIDFGLSKFINKRTWTLCGTPEYIAPEILLNHGYAFSVDIWSYGVLLFELSSGKSPFKHSDPLILYENILQVRYTFPNHFSEELKDLISKIFVVAINDRICGSGISKEDIKKHKWFNGLNWNAILNRTITPPIQPSISDPMDSSYFDKYDENTFFFKKENHYGSIFEDF